MSVTLTNNIAEAMAQIRVTAAGMLNAAAKETVDVAQGLCPYDAANTDPNHVHIRDGLQVAEVATPASLEATASALAPHSGYVELGTTKMAAQPYFLPAIEQAKRQFSGVRVVLVSSYQPPVVPNVPGVEIVIGEK